MDERFRKQMDFILAADKEKQIFRQTYLSDGKRKENDAEHAWHLALMAVLLNEYANEKIDVLKVVTMVLIHDIVEIDAGDTFAYDKEGQKTAHEREQKAAVHLFGLLPEDQGNQFMSLWEEFEAYGTPEARFAHTLDNFQPLMLNNASDGKSWKEHQVKKENILKRNEKTGSGSEKIWDYMKLLIEKNVEKGAVLQ